MAAFQITNIHIFWDRTSSRHTSEASADSFFRVQYVLPGLLNQALNSSFGLRMSWKRGQESLYLSIRHHKLEESSLSEPEFSHTFLCLYIFCGFQYHRSFVLSILPFQLTSSLLCLHIFIVKTVLVCFFRFPAFCLLCHEAAVQAPF